MSQGFFKVVAMTDDYEPPVRKPKADWRCRCGGHHGGAKSNRWHNGTWRKLVYRRLRRMAQGGRSRVWGIWGAWREIVEPGGS